MTIKEGSDLTSQVLQDWLKPKIANFKLPKYVAIVENFETLGMTASGKVQKNKLIEDAYIRFNLNSIEKK